MLHDGSAVASWEHFHHGADIGIRGTGGSKLQAFEQAALALTAVVTEPEKVRAVHGIEIRCSSDDDEFLFLDWINALIYEMATRGMLFGRFHLAQDGATLHASVWGEPVDVARHCPAVEPKGATLTELKVKRSDNGIWTAQCVVDV
ncbi:MAG TPA: archease [Noviherbaspirillum sp.]|nr:archease [Noviherbaspirillum sp.]